jgi:predicted nucleotidyltransferase/uncharacterized protein (UPF0332 family)
MANKKSTSKKKTKKKRATKKSSHKRVKLRTEKDIALDFAVKVHEKFSSIVKATILFGSQTKSTHSSKSDIDIIIIIDDAAINWDLELVAWYREELAKIIAASKYSKELHINTIKLTTWWNDLMHGDAVIINILRYGEALIDIGGFYNPLKALLIQGKIHSTPEAVYVALQRAPTHLARSKYAQINAIEGVYWTMVDAAQAALTTLGKLPPSPEHITSMLKQNFVDHKLLKIDYVKWYRDIYHLHKDISHGNINSIKGIEIDEWQNRAEKFLLQMTNIIDSLIEARKKE